MKKRKNKRFFYTLISFVPAIIMMIIIYRFSASDATESSASSSMIVDGLIRFLRETHIIDVTDARAVLLAEQLTFPVRKCAHMTEYAVLAVCFLWGYHNLLKVNKYKVAFFSTVLYAASDEFHQLFVPGRSGKIVDVGIDSIGAIIILCVIYCFTHRKIKS